ncbi:hypothetical protein LB941_00180 [Ligilactobacillus sp. WILCCON 0076]|uniref:Uncharacterized protein n=1 Tax=Ligilactobacillus ubinensis TaxID=2876789 RepID=A0A9X2JJM8_9LACO|nr:cell division protein ZapB [Ligilactobacillus ubinensis]MCP0885747.1 hypothetical protein [Ligilactobacillus ubinensis]
MLKKILLKISTLWRTNSHQVNFWVSLSAFSCIVLLLIAKWIWHITISTADISVIISAIGSLIILIGNILNNHILVTTGSQLQTPQLEKTIEEANQTIELLTKEIELLKQQNTTKSKNK